MLKIKRNGNTLINKSEIEKEIVKAINNGNIEKVKTILDYAFSNKIDLNLNLKKGMYFFSWACVKNNIDLIHLLMSYAIDNDDFVLKLNKKDENGNYPLLWACYHNNMNMLQLLINYANQKHIILKMNEINDNGYYPLLWACYYNNMEMVKLLIEYAINKDIILELNEKEGNGMYPLYWAYYNNNIEMAKLLIDYSNIHNTILEITGKNKNSMCPLLWAFDKNNTELFQLLVDYAVKNNIILKLNEKSRNGNYSLLWACYHNNVEMVKLLFDYAIKNYIIVDLNERNENGIYPLLWACYNNNIEIVKLLIDYINVLKLLNLNDKQSLYWSYYNNNVEMIELLNAYFNSQIAVLELNRKDVAGFYPLYWACYKDNIEMLRLLINYANENNITLILNENDRNGLYPLLLACEKDNIEMVQLLIGYANDNNIILKMNEVFENGNCPLYWACYWNNIELVQLLFEYADKNSRLLKLNGRDKNGMCPFYCACENNNLKLIQLLINYSDSHGISLELNVRDKNGVYPFYCACENNNIEMVQLLINYSISKNTILELNRKDAGGFYPLYWACFKNNIEMIRLLINYCNSENVILELNETNENGLNPLYWACYYNNIEIVQILMEYANENNIILIINGITQNGYYPLYWAFYQNNMEMIQLLMDYADKNNILLEYKESDYEDNSEIRPEIIEVLKKYKDKNKSLLPTLVIAINDFTAQEYYQLDIKKNEFLFVTNWDCEIKGWVYGYRKDNKQEKGMFPEVFIKKYEDENIEKRNTVSEISPGYRINFEKKVRMFRNQYSLNPYNLNLNIYINRKSLFYDAYYQIMRKSPLELKSRLRIKYKGEEGLDAGGLLRDFFYQISKDIGNPNYSLFQYSNSNSYELEINPISSINPEHLNYFKFIGRILGLAIYHRQYLTINFTLLFYKKLLNKPLEFSDMEFIDPEIYKNIKWLQEHDGVENLGLDFTLNIEDCFGNHRVIELKPNGANIDVTDSNKNEYINLVIKYKLKNTNDKQQLIALKHGFYEIIPIDIKEIFNELDLKYLISGFNEIDVDDWERNTVYEGYNRNDITIVHFWKCVREFTNENRTKLLLFATGTSQIPVTGFKDLQGDGHIKHFTLKKVLSPDIQNTLPISHTCFNRIDLPPYTTYTTLKQKLLRAISEGMGNFSIE